MKIFKNSLKGQKRVKMINDISKKVLNDFKRVLKSFKRYFENKFLHSFKTRDFILPKITLIISKNKTSVKDKNGNFRA